eukprot:scaffold39461_cov48-Phaeocystis_antarctica.AAC.1
MALVLVLYCTSIILVPVLCQHWGGWWGAQSLAAGQRPRPLTARALYARTSVSVGASEASMGSGIDVGSGHWCAGGRQVRRCAGRSEQRCPHHDWQRGVRAL